MTFITWLTATSKWMHLDRPELFPSESSALLALEDACNTLYEMESQTISFAGFLLFRYEDDGVIEWSLTKRISSCDIFLEEDECNVYGWTNNSASMAFGVDLPDVSEDLDIDVDGNDA